MQTTTANAILDARGKTISTFLVYEANRLLDKVRNGETLKILTDDFEPLRVDIAAWCEATGQQLLGANPP